LSAELSDTTGRLLDKYLQTACPPPRQEDQDSDGLLPPQEHRHAEALHQLLAGYGSSPQAATRHGHTATLDLTVDIETLQGKDTGRLPLLEGDPISVPRARLLACEGVVIPSVFNYATGEAIELGRALRLPNTALRRKLELEQPGGCAWSGCGRPVAWTEAHHIQHWADGGPTIAENLILLCRFHHGRIHTTGWTVEKTGPGQAIITHHDHAGIQSDPTDTTAGCGCSDWRTDQDMDTEHTGTDWDVFPTGLYRTEWSETMKPDLDALAEAIDRDRALKAMKAARAKCRAKFTTPNQATPAPPQQVTPPIVKAPKPSEPSKPLKVMAGPDREVDYGEPPFLLCPQRATAEGKRRNTSSAARHPYGFGPLSMHRQQTHPGKDPEQAPPIAEERAQPSTQPFVAARLNQNPIDPTGRRTRQG
ncbi:HNH endonuclease signature motif containing protein, partial [Glycomyces rhizosphaerae]